MDARILDPASRSNHHTSVSARLMQLGGSGVYFRCDFDRAVLVREQMWTWLKIHIACAAFVQVVLLFGDASADRVTASVFGRHIDPYRRTMDGGNLRAKRAHRAQGKCAGNSEATPVPMSHPLFIILRDTKPRVFMWPREFDTDNYFGRTVPLTEQAVVVVAGYRLLHADPS